MRNPTSRVVRLLWVVVVVLVVATVVMSRSRQQREPVGAGRWRATHYEANGVTRVVGNLRFD